MRQFRIETEDRYGRFNDYDITATNLEEAKRIANKRANLPNGATVFAVYEIFLTLKIG